MTTMTEAVTEDVEERPLCDTCGDSGRVPWMIEGDPNCYQEPDDDGTLPCPDCAGRDTLTLHEMVEALHGLTYRRLDYWVRMGYLSPERAAPGTGYARRWTLRDLDMARIIMGLTAAGFSVQVAADAARRFVDSGEDTLVVDTAAGLVQIAWKVG